MAQLIKNVEGEILTNILDELNYLRPIIGVVQQEDYINLNGFIAYLQNFSKTELVANLNTPIGFGLKNLHNISIVELEIDY
jgi:hypothetical protein